MWAAVAPWTRKKDALVVRGNVQNHDMQDYVDVRVRALVVDEQDRVIAEAEGPIGAWITGRRRGAMGERLSSVAGMRGREGMRRPPSLPQFNPALTCDIARPV